MQLWPEHFDLATSIGEVNYGGSPGDAGHDRALPLRRALVPAPPRRGVLERELRGQPGSDRVRDADTALAFFRRGLSLPS